MDDKMIRKNMLLRSFLQQCLNEYWNEIDMHSNYSWKKYTACLLMITNISLNEISRFTGVSYGLLRKWRTETPFKQMINKHREEYLALFNIFITDMLKTPYIKENAILSSWYNQRKFWLSDPEKLASVEEILANLESQGEYGVTPELKIPMMNLLLDKYKDNEYVVTFFRYPIISDLIDVHTKEEYDQVLLPFLRMCIDWCLRRTPNSFNGHSEKKLLTFTLNKMKEHLNTGPFI
jgi:hypothetical protein